MLTAAPNTLLSSAGRNDRVVSGASRKAAAVATNAHSVIVIGSTDIATYPRVNTGKSQVPTRFLSVKQRPLNTELADGAGRPGPNRAIN
jgi:hypothetical protein